MALSVEDKKGVKIIVGSMLVIAVMFSLIAWQKHLKDYDELTLCPKNIAYDSKVFIFDKSDSWKKSDSKKIKKLIQNVSNDLGKFERLTIHVLSSSDDNKNSELGTRFDMCNPGSEANPLYENPRKILAKYNDAFKGPIEELLKQLIEPGVARNSPIFSAIYDSAKNNKGRSKHVILVSDLLENSGNFNFYRKIPSEKEVLKEYPLNDLGISKLTVNYIKRNKYDPSFLQKSERVFRNIANNIDAEYELERFISTAR